MVLLAGCEGPPPTIYPTEFSLHLDYCVTSYERGREFVEKGAAYWEVMGIRSVVDGPSPHIIEVGCLPQAALHSYAGEYVGNGVVKLDVSDWPAMVRDGYLDEPACVTAHEFGHAFGLQHVEGEAVMNPNLFDLKEITEIDEVEWRRVHP